MLLEEKVDDNTKRINEYIQENYKNTTNNALDEATLEFLDETFTETTPDNKTEQKYTCIERVSIITDKIIYIHINNVTAYLIPMSSFASSEELRSFIDFIKTKAPIVDIY